MGLAETLTIVGTSVGWRVGKDVGGKDGTIVGLPTFDGTVVGKSVESFVGARVGCTVGYVDGSELGHIVGAGDGPSVGSSVELLLGATDGVRVGKRDGASDGHGATVGYSVPFSGFDATDGMLEETFVGESVGVIVGSTDG